MIEERKSVVIFLMTFALLKEVVKWADTVKGWPTMYRSVRQISKQAEVAASFSYITGYLLPFILKSIPAELLKKRRFPADSLSTLRSMILLLFYGETKSSSLMSLNARGCHSAFICSLLLLCFFVFISVSFDLLIWDAVWHIKAPLQI